MGTICHLVHGTFAHEAEWIHENSPLAKRLKATLGSGTWIAPFTWSGDNSHSARRLAGERLAQQIHESAAEHPDSPQIIVAHSHGGNVASYALENTQARSKIASVVCLGTPFIKAQARDTSGAKLLIRLVLIACIVSAVILPALAFLQVPQSAGEGSPLPGVSTEDLELIRPILETPIILAVMSIALFGGIAWLFSRPFVWSLRFVNRKGLAGIAAAQEHIVRALNARFGATPVLVVDAMADEAARWLHLIGTLARLPYKIWSPSRFLVIALLILSVLFVIDAAFEGAQMGLLLVMPLMIFVLLTTAIAIPGWLLNLILPAIFRSTPMGFGWDDFWQNFLVEIESAELPQDSAHVTHESVRITGKGLRHSRLYKEPAVFDLIDDWLLANAARPA